MRRVYYMTPKRQQVVDDAMVQLRETQEMLGPEFLTRIRLLIKDFDPESLSKNEVEPAPITLVATHMEPVDQKKNLMTIMKFLQMHPDNKSIQTRIRTLLSKTNTIQ